MVRQDVQDYDATAQAQTSILINCATSLLQAHALRAPVQLERRRKSSGEVAADEELSRDEVIRRLRALQQPVTLFGEARSWLGHR